MLEGFGAPRVPGVRAKLNRPWRQFVGEPPTRVRNVATGERFGARVDDSSADARYGVATQAVLGVGDGAGMTFEDVRLSGDGR